MNANFGQGGRPPALDLSCENTLNIIFIYKLIARDMRIEE
jgi:hypothetical protein